jgi:Fic family protein
MSYKPPYTITDKILTKVSDIVELVSELNNIKKEFNTPKLRKKNRVKSITGTLQIEGNTFDEDKITKVIDGKVVLGSMREIEEGHFVRCYLFGNPSIPNSIGSSRESVQERGG